MADLERLLRADISHAAADAVELPDFSAIERRGMRRRRNRAVLTVAAAAVVALMIATAHGSFSDRRHATQPAQDPSPSPVAGWTPERIRAEGSPEIGITTASGLTVRQYVACRVAGCEDGNIQGRHLAVEVSQDGRSGLFDVQGDYDVVVDEFDHDSVLVQDHLGGEDQDVRRRLLQADGSAVLLRMVNATVPAIPGPDVVVIDLSQGMMSGAESLFLVDHSAATLQRLDAPAAVRYWGPNVDEFLWGVSDDCHVFWSTDGTFEDHRLDCRRGSGITFMGGDWFPPDWLRPGRMVMGEQAYAGDRTILHVTLDSGATWQRIPVDKNQAVADVLRGLG